MTLDEIRRAETRLFFSTLTALNECRGIPTIYEAMIDEMEAIALHSDQPWLKRCAQRIVEQARSGAAGEPARA